MFRVGQKVVCVDDVPTPGCIWLPGSKPTAGNIYTITGKKKTSRCSPVEHYVVFVAELRNPFGYKIQRFRPIVERKTDISIFTALLNTKKMREPANG